MVTIADLAILGVEKSEISTSRTLLADNHVKISSYCSSAVNNVLCLSPSQVFNSWYWFRYHAKRLQSQNITAFGRIQWNRKSSAISQAPPNNARIAAGQPISWYSMYKSKKFLSHNIWKIIFTANENTFSKTYTLNIRSMSYDKTWKIETQLDWRPQQSCQSDDHACAAILILWL